MLRTVDLIQKKRDGNELTSDELRFLVDGFVKGEIPDYQISAWLMAIFFRGMSEREVYDLTMAMVDSGDVIDLSKVMGVKVDKHSTGGVGDTTTLILAPLVATLGVPVAKMSGRSLGFTGGTLDKLEAISGFSTQMSESNFIRSVNEIGVAVIGQSKEVTPSDRLLYALRDVTATVDSLPLIASSIMSKKIAAGADALVLDVTVGSGAFMKNLEEAIQLSKQMVRIGQLAGKKTIAVVSDMSEPLGCAIGNALEVIEAIETLKGNGPKDLEEVVLTLGSQMALLSGVVQSLEEAREKMLVAMRNGSALDKLKEMVVNQGGNIEVIDSPEMLLTAKVKVPFLAKSSGYIEEIATDQLGNVVMNLGAGRRVKTDRIDPSVGMIIHKKLGDYVSEGEAILTIHANQENLTEIFESLDRCFKIGHEKRRVPLIHAVIDENDV